MARFNRNWVWGGALIVTCIHCGGRVSGGDDSSASGGNTAIPNASAGRGCDTSDAGAGPLDAYARLRSAPAADAGIDRGATGDICERIR